MTARTPFLRGWICLALIAAVAGCRSAAPAPISPPSEESRLGFEYLPSSAVSPADGGYRVAPGPDAVLVITRTTAAMDASPGREPRWRDARVERVWLTLPPGGTASISLADLERDGGAVYAAGRSAAALEARTADLSGSLRITLADRGGVLADLALHAKPADGPAWSIGQVVSVPVSRPAAPAVAAAPVAAPPAPPAPAPVATATAAPAPAPTPAPASAPATASAPASQPERSIVGKWMTQAGGFDLRFQFDTDRTFVYSSTRGGGNYAPGLKSGRWALEGDFVTLYVSRFTFDNMDHMKFLAKPYITLRVGWDGSRLKLKGDLGDREKQQDLTLWPGDFPDMKLVEPPRGTIEPKPQPRGRK